jgi:hypothetical protein
LLTNGQTGGHTADVSGGDGTYEATFGHFENDVSIFMQFWDSDTITVADFGAIALTSIPPAS